MKKFVALMLAALCVLSMSSVAFAVVGSGTGGTNSEAASSTTSARMAEEIKKSVAAQIGVAEGSVTNYACAKVGVGNYKGETFPIKLNMPATLNGQTVKVAVQLKDGSWKILSAVVENGSVSFDAPVANGYATFMVYTANGTVQG